MDVDVSSKNLIAKERTTFGEENVYNEMRV